MGRSQSREAPTRVTLEREGAILWQIASYKLGTAAVVVVFVAFCPAPVAAAAAAGLQGSTPSASPTSSPAASQGASVLIWAFLLVAAALPAVLSMMFFDNDDFDHDFDHDDDYDAWDDDDDGEGFGHGHPDELDEFDDDAIVQYAFSVDVPFDGDADTALEPLQQFYNDQRPRGLSGYNALYRFLEDHFKADLQGLFFFGLHCVRTRRFCEAEAATEALEVLLESKKWRKDAFKQLTQALALLKTVALNTHLPDWTGRWQQVQATPDPFTSRPIAAVFQQRDSRKDGARVAGDDDAHTAVSSQQSNVPARRPGANGTQQQPPSSSSASEQQATTGPSISKCDSSSHRTGGLPSPSDAGAHTAFPIENSNLCTAPAGARPDDADAHPLPTFPALDTQVPAADPLSSKSTPPASGAVLRPSVHHPLSSPQGDHTANSTEKSNLVPERVGAYTTRVTPAAQVATPAAQAATPRTAPRHPSSRSKAVHM